MPLVDSMQRLSKTSLLGKLPFQLTCNMLLVTLIKLRKLLGAIGESGLAFKMSFVWTDRSLSITQSQWQIGRIMQNVGRLVIFRC